MVSGELFPLVILALLERGGPMTLRALAERLAEARATSVETLAWSIARACDGLEPVTRDDDGLFRLDVDCAALQRFLEEHGLRTE